VTEQAPGRLPARDPCVAERRRYTVTTAAAARRIARAHLRGLGLRDGLLGLPEVDDRYHVWRISLSGDGSAPPAEIVVDAYQAVVDTARSSGPALLARHSAAAGPGRGDGGRGGSRNPGGGGPGGGGPGSGGPGSGGPGSGGPARIPPRAGEAAPPRLSPLPDLAIRGDATTVLNALPSGSVDLVFTSPPYFNARRSYAEFASYQEYLQLLERVFAHCHRLLAEGRFLVVNVSPVLLRRVGRASASRRVPVPFHLNAVLEALGFEFLDDIHWMKPAGAGWALGRGRRFAADRQPLQYKPVVVTEYVLVYRRATDKLIDWNLRNHPDPEAVRASLIEDGYERTNIWQLPPSSDRRHPAPFPEALAERAVSYYSFRGDVVLDPFAGSGTTARIAYRLGRRSIAVDIDPAALALMRADAAAGLLAPGTTWLDEDAGPAPFDGLGGQPPAPDGQ
jgi:DNA modification methylase